jgi:hypothetical protein
MPVILPQPTKAHQRAWQSLSERVGTVATIDLSVFTANWAISAALSFG